MGSIVGGLYACGISPKVLEEKILKLKVLDFFDLNTFKIFVPNSLVETYKNDQNWHTYRNNIEGYGSMISALPNDSFYGDVSGSGVYEQGDEVTLQATCHDLTHNYWDNYECVYLFVG